MDVIIGIDIGGTNTKIASVDSDGQLLSGCMLDASCTDLEGEVSKMAESGGFNVHSIAITGVGSYRVEKDIIGITPFRSHEFTAIGLGGLTAAGLDEAIIVSMGTGTAFIHAKNGEYRHIIGAGVGGGTLLGLCEKLVGTGDYGEIEALAAGGDLSKIDLTMGEITQGTLPSLDPNLTASNFAGVKPDAGASDLALGVITLVLHTVGTMSILAAKSAGIRDIVLTGAVSASVIAPEVYELFSHIYGYNFQIPSNAVYSTAIGAALDCMKHKRDLH